MFLRSSSRNLLLIIAAALLVLYLGYYQPLGFVRWSPQTDFHISSSSSRFFSSDPSASQREKIESKDANTHLHRSRPASTHPLLYGPTYTGHSTPSDINRVTNSTLGFSKVFVVGLPERTDKRDALTLLSAVTGFDIEWVDGVKGESVSDKAIPWRTDRKKLWESNLGSWRGHLDAVRRIVDESLSSALIMEDDMDWDVRLKPQLERIAQGSRALLPYPTPPQSFLSHTHPPSSPYGDDWDILWLGHCGELFPELLDENRGRSAADPGLQYMARKFVISDDLTVPSRSRVTGLIDFGNAPEHTRWVHLTGAPICSFAYALSQSGARKVLYDMSVGRDEVEAPFDNTLARLCQRSVSSWTPAPFSDSGLDSPGGEGRGDSGLDTRCISVTPPIFFHHRPRGPMSGDSDIQNGSGGEDVRQKGSSENIVWSARLNVGRMIKGESWMENQFGDI
ncbi:glycosyltransferase family 25 protein [Xylariaceae sp. FL0016]|nr:glycosyltransferase family 25 protein [Xylariaceae sp. FL0016]